MRFSDDFLSDLRDRIEISDVIGSRVTWDRRKTNVRRGDHWACCPFHGESTPSFHCEDRKGRYHCFGCGKSGDHFKFFMELDGVTFPRAVEMVADLAGVSIPDARPLSPTEQAERDRRAKARAENDARRREDDARDAERRVETVRGIWSEAIPIKGTPAELYLIGRGIPAMAWPASLRFHPGLMIEGVRRGALVCGVQSKDRALVAVWRIPLSDDGQPIIGADGRKIKLGFGPAGGGAVRLGPAGEEVNVCEGVETGFGVGCLTKWRLPVWPLLSTSGMTGWEPPSVVKRVGIYSDGDKHKFNKQTGLLTDPPGRVAANALRDRLVAMGIVVTVHEPPAGSDWLDVWRSLRRDEEAQRSVTYLDGAV